MSQPGSEGGHIYDLSGRRVDPAALAAAPAATTAPRNVGKPKLLISVIVPVHDVPAALLRPSLNSLSQQTLRAHEFEIVVVDDCSKSAETLEELDRFIASRSNVKLIRHQQNLGSNEARRSGLNASAGDYVLFVDGDDLLTREALEALRIEAANSRADIITAPFFRWNNSNYTFSEIPITAEPFPSDYVERLQSVLSGQRSFTMCGRLFRRGLLDNGVMDLPSGHLHEDVATCVRALFKASTVAHHQGPLYYYTINPGSKTRNFTPKHAEDMLAAIRDWITCAYNAGLYKQLSDSMALGAEKMINVCVERCLFDAGMNEEDKLQTLEFMQKEYAALPLPRIDVTLAGTKLMSQISVEELRRKPELLAEVTAGCFPKGRPAHMKPPLTLKRGLGPSDLAHRLRGRIVFVAQVDYHVRGAAPLAKRLAEYGYDCVILDNSGVVAKGKRKFTRHHADNLAGVEYVSVPQCPYGDDWLATAKLVVTFNDNNNETRAALEYRTRVGLPIVGMVEGISDFLRVDFDSYRHQLPYRRSDYVFLAGEDDQSYFEDRETRVVGLPIIEKMIKTKPTFPQTPLAVLNVNFTYHALEDERDGFVASAKSAFDAANLEWTITKHPMDNGALAGMPVSTKTQYQLIDECSVFVSRFATGILEALASGKPVIYFNPHGEKVQKYKDPLGAFEIANSTSELVQALNRTLADIESGVDFRERAMPFLRRHTAYSGESNVADRFAIAVSEILSRSPGHSRRVSELFCERLGREKSSDAVAKAQFLHSEVQILWSEIRNSERHLAEVRGEGKRREAALRSEFGQELQLIGQKLASIEKGMSDSGASLHADIASLRTEMKSQLEDATRATAANTQKELEKDRAEVGRLGERIASSEKHLTSIHSELSESAGSLRSDIESLRTDMKLQLNEVSDSGATLRTDIASLRTEMKSQLEDATKAISANTQKELEKDRAIVKRLRARVASSESQIGSLRYPSTPATLVFFGHHKCASRFFRNEVFATIAEATEARIRRYKVKHAPFHYSMSDELDLVNIDLTGLGENGRDVVMFSNATARSLDRLNRMTQDWKGLRILRDPRQVLVSDYFHHKGEHVTELNGWIWDQLAKDKPILRELPIEDGLLYELDNISKQIIETQVLAPFDDPRIMTIKIEEFSRDPKRHLKEISEFLGVAQIAGIDFTRTAANPESGPWQRYFTSKLRAVFKERYGQALIDLGYAEDLDW